MRCVLLAIGALLFGGISSGLANQNKPIVQWKTFGYSFSAKTVDQCMLRANAALAANKFTMDMNSGNNGKGTYGYVYGWTADYKTTALIICDYDDKESVLIFSHYGKNLDSVKGLYKGLEKGKW